MDVGFVGLGAMGQGIVPRLIADGHTVTGWNRTPEKAKDLVQGGMQLADTPREAASQSEIVFTCVTDAEAVRAVAFGPDGIISGMPENGIFLDNSTIAPDQSRAIAEEFAAAGRIMLDAPISGSPVTLEQGQASVMVGEIKTPTSGLGRFCSALVPK